MATGPDCHTCNRSTTECSTCHGHGQIPAFGKCTECDGTGYRCPDHGKHWH